jgi:hypothetical protein
LCVKDDERDLLFDKQIQLQNQISEIEEEVEQMENNGSMKLEKMKRESKEETR